MLFRCLTAASLMFFGGAAAAQPAKVPPLNMAAFKAGFPQLKDPASLQVRNPVYKVKEPGVWLMCGEFNAKNSFGGYHGFQRFFAIAGLDNTGKKMTYAMVATGADASEMCAEERL